VVVDRARRCQTDRIGNLPDGGRIAAFFDGVRDAVENPLSALCVVPGQGVPPHFGAMIGLRVGTVAEHMF